MSDKDVIQGKIKQVEGKVEDAYGDLTNQPEHDVKGKAKQVAGKAQEIKGRADNAVKEALKTDDEEADDVEERTW